MINRPRSAHFVWTGVIAAALLITGSVVNAKIKAITNKNLKNKSALTQVLSGFDNQSIGQLRQEINTLKSRIVNLSVMFDPKERWFKKDYDLSIHFVEELGKVNSSLKTKAAEKRVDFQELGFKEKLPSESEAFYLLSQLSGIKEIVGLGLGYSVNFKSIVPEAIESLEEFPEIRLAKSRIGLSCPAQGLIEFIIQLNEIIPVPYTESFSLKAQDSSFEMELAVDNIIVDLNWKDKDELLASSEQTEKGLLSEKDENFIRVLRSTNPFLELTQKSQSQSQETSPQVKSEKPKLQQRFFYQGKAMLKSKEIAVIEDALNQETLFLAQGEKIGNFTLEKIFTDHVILKNIDDKKEIAVKRSEE